ncbi:MAG: hypothetical protein CMJ58_11630 [Planctomycetaceae bacterium]|nr:hypothetical protein [Planctomycetaceae bacterium]
MKNAFLWVFSIVVIVICALGFGDKLIQFIRLVSQADTLSKDGLFAVTPIANYLLASFGFLMLMGWAAANGMFTDIERPKETMLDHEEMLDRDRDDTHCADSVLK